MTFGLVAVPNTNMAQYVEFAFSDLFDSWYNTEEIRLLWKGDGQVWVDRLIVNIEGHWFISPLSTRVVVGQEDTLAMEALALRVGPPYEEEE